jgi:uncharacterized protein YcaQ
MHYRGLLRVARRESGIRLYELRESESPVDAQAGVRPVSARERRRRLDALVDVVVNLYAPLPAASLSYAVRRLRYATPQWSSEISGALQRAKERLAHARVDGVSWYWPAGERPGAIEPADSVRLLAPFDPVVWDRRRFELLWNWPYRFEAYTPVAKRRWGYYALPLLWREQMIGWANVSGRGHAITFETGYVRGKPPRDREFRQALDEEYARFRAFLGLSLSHG